jgi:hypothetical protein
VYTTDYPRLDAATGEWANADGSPVEAHTEIEEIITALSQVDGASIMALPRSEMETGLTPRFIGNLYLAELRGRTRSANQTANEAEVDVMWLEAQMALGTPPVVAVYLPSDRRVAYVSLAPGMARKLIRFAWRNDQCCPSVVAWNSDGERLSLHGLPIARALVRLFGRSYAQLTEIAFALESGLIAPEEGAGWLTFGGPAGGGIVELLETEAYR